MLQEKIVTIAVPLSPRKWALLQLLQNSSLAGDDAAVDAAFGAFEAPELAAVPDADPDDVA
jgi:hypothetical protein